MIENRVCSAVLHGLGPGHWIQQSGTRDLDTLRSESEIVKKKWRKSDEPDMPDMPGARVLHMIQEPKIRNGYEKEKGGLVSERKKKRQD